ncbi:Homocysteine S-methyltransferase 1, partial [Trichinella pseudospiralis]
LMTKMPLLRGPLVLDGSMATTLLNAGCDYIEDDPLWSSRALLKDPKKVLQTHLDVFFLSFLKVGADIVQTNTYQACISRLQDVLGISIRESYEIVEYAASLARRSIEHFVEDNGRNISEYYVAGSVGPYAVSLCDGSEYSGRYIQNTPVSEIRKYYHDQFCAMTMARVDFIALETMPSLTEAKIALEIILIKQLLCCSFLIDFQDEYRTNYGDLFSDVVYEISKCPGVTAVGINCTKPDFISGLLKQARNVLMPFVVYPNSGRWTRATGWVEPPYYSKPIGERVQEWIELGARIIGGCCGVSPLQLAEVSKSVKGPLVHNCHF